MYISHFTLHERPAHMPGHSPALHAAPQQLNGFANPPVLTITQPGSPRHAYLLNHPIHSLSTPPASKPALCRSPCCHCRLPAKLPCWLPAVWLCTTRTLPARGLLAFSLCRGGGFEPHICLEKVRYHYILERPGICAFLRIFVLFFCHITYLPN